MEFHKDKPTWLEFNILKKFPNITQAVFSRHGGVSEGSFTSLNLGDAVGDNPRNVQCNRERAAEALGLSHVIFPHQTHGTQAAQIHARENPPTIQGDILFTTDRNVGIAVTHADCQAAILFDPKHQAIAIVHAGWRGMVQNVYQAAVTALTEALGTKPQDLIACISPSLGPEHAEFKLNDLPESFHPFQVKPHYFDLWAAAEWQLTEAGLAPQNIEIARICTVCNSNDYFSHRKEHKSGRNATIVALR